MYVEIIIAQTASKVNTIGYDLGIKNPPMRRGKVRG
jgi:hypothetical protein